jgi:hypothetical protein
VGSNADELAGLVGKRLTVEVGRGTDPAVVYLIGGQRYRNDDGTFVAADPNGP